MTFTNGCHGADESPGDQTVITVGSLTDVGMQRSSNQDSYCVLGTLDVPLGSDALWAVADGVGGLKDGEVASAMAIEGLVSRLSRDGDSNATKLGVAHFEAFLARVVQEVNVEVFQASGQRETGGMGTTLTAALMVGSTLIVAHVGDSRAYLMRKGKLRQLTQDHSWVGEAVRRSAMTPQQAREHPRRSILTRALGVAPRIQVDIIPIEMKKGDTLLISSDGLHSLVNDEEIRRILTSEDPQAACRSLLAVANAAGGHDNTTLIVARIERLRREWVDFLAMERKFAWVPRLILSPICLVVRLVQALNRRRV